MKRRKRRGKPEGNEGTGSEPNVQRPFRPMRVRHRNGEPWREPSLGARHLPKPGAVQGNRPLQRVWQTTGTGGLLPRRVAKKGSRTALPDGRPGTGKASASKAPRYSRSSLRRMRSRRTGRLLPEGRRSEPPKLRWKRDREGCEEPRLLAKLERRAGRRPRFPDGQPSRIVRVRPS
jgi:hypothetical protein